MREHPLKNWNFKHDQITREKAKGPRRETNQVLTRNINIINLVKLVILLKERKIINHKSKRTTPTIVRREI